jgi:hypothetical protein
MLSALRRLLPQAGQNVNRFWLGLVWGMANSYHSMIKFLLICPTSALEKIFNPQNILYILPVKNCFRLEFEQIP